MRPERTDPQQLAEAQRGLENVLDLLLDLGLQARRRERAQRQSDAHDPTMIASREAKRAP